ncbi:DsbA family protein [Neptunomonas antarctica]|uniref:DSBA-like thioredoxin domain-containing protein n=1 Tax=Neptunomonas antarctica TaxID=619304 RepID=A0A1N7MUT9_9GAMM|nr:DsbA family protein [Neptunomonas antarctica]SIS89822.1 putative protein-disulfide isomerase [Neptunomonas antarctica]
MQLLYIMDPMCSWCWAFSPTLQTIEQTFPDLPIQYVVGGLAPDTDDLMPQEQQDMIRSIWQQIEARTETVFNYDFWTLCSPRRSTWRACRAILVAEQLKPGSAGVMAKAIQQAYYLVAKNPSDRETLIALAETLNINTTEFSALLDAPSTQQQFDDNLMLSRQLDVSGFPALRLLNQDKAIRISDGYSGPDAIIERLHAAIAKQ